MKSIAYGIEYLLSRYLGRKGRPLICGLVLTNACNLRCRHCRIPARGEMPLRWDEIVGVIESFYRRGGRALYLEGGEPFLWRDGDRRLEDIVERAHAIGYRTVIIYTNGTIPLRTSAEVVFVSLDGLKETHDFLRGESFERIIANVRESSHPSLFANYTINSRNKDEIEAFLRYADSLGNLKGTFFYIHTPYYGRDELCLEPPERARVLRELIEHAKKYRILNSRAGLRCALRNDWKRPLDVCWVYEGGKTYTCCRYPGDPELCRECGYLSYAEIDQVLKLKPSAIVKALKYF